MVSIYMVFSFLALVDLSSNFAWLISQNVSFSRNQNGHKSGNRYTSDSHSVFAYYTVKLGDKERFDKEQIGVKEPFSVIK